MAVGDSFPAPADPHPNALSWNTPGKAFRADFAQAISLPVGYWTQSWNYGATVHAGFGFPVGSGNPYAVYFLGSWYGGTQVFIAFQTTAIITVDLRYFAVL